MAATIARCLGFNRNGAAAGAGASRLGSGSAWAQAATWYTFADVTIRPDGSGSFILKRPGRETVTSSWGPETEAVKDLVCTRCNGDDAMCRDCSVSQETPDGDLS